MLFWHIFLLSWYLVFFFFGHLISFLPYIIITFVSFQQAPNILGLGVNFAKFVAMGVYSGAKFKGKTL